MLQQAARATARASVDDAKAAAHRRVEEEYAALAAMLEQRMGDVVQALLPPHEASIRLAARFLDTLCVLPGKCIDSDIMTYLKPRLVHHAADDNDMVVEISYTNKYPFGEARPAWIAVVQGGNFPGCKEWYHILQVQPADNLAKAVAWAAGDGRQWGATLHVTKLPSWKVEDSFHNKLQRQRALLLVDVVTQEPPATAPRPTKRRCVVDESD